MELEHYDQPQENELGHVEGNKDVNSVSDTESAPEQKEESALTYDSIFEKAERIGALKNPKSYLKSVIWRRYYDLVRNGLVTYDELFHEAVVGLYLALETIETERELEEDEAEHEVYRSVWSQLEKYKREILGRRQGVLVSQLGQEARDYSDEEMADRLRFKIKLEAIKDETSDEIVQDDFITDLLKKAKKIITEEGESKRQGQGIRDWEVFVRYLSGDNIEDICVCCPWLSSTDSVEKALERIILQLRKGFGADERASVLIFSEGRRTGVAKDERTFDRQQYYKEWYESHKEEVRDRMREYQRRRRQKDREE